MGWFKKLLGFAAVVGAAFLTFGGSIAAAGAWLTSGSIGAMVARTVLTIGLSKLIANRAGTKAAGGDAPSARFQARPSTTNKIPLVYGSGYYGSVIVDAIISTDNKTMWYVMACAEVTDSGTLSFGDMYIDNRLITFDGTDQTKVVSLTNNANPPQVDTNIDGNMYIYKYSNGSSSGVNTAQTAIQVLQDSAIPVDRRWTSTNTMTDTAFVIVKLNYNVDKQVTGLGELKVNMINSLNKPGAVLLDYMQNTRYGCAIPITQIDTASLTALDTYSDQLITYTPDGGGSATQARYRINGPIDLNINCLSNLQTIADACDSWIQYSELVGKWKVVINKPYTGTLSSLYSIDSSVLIGGIDITPLDLNQTYNSVEVQFPSGVIKDQNVVRVIDLTDPSTNWYSPNLLSPNEANNRLTIPYQIVNNYVQAVYLGVRRLLQSREDLTINCNLDYSGIQIEAGDVVRVTLAEYDWVDKLFRVSTVSEIKREDGNLGASIVAFEYNGDIYDDQAIDEYVPTDNTGLTDPNILGIPGTPVAVKNLLANSGAVTSFNVSSTVPSSGLVMYMDFNYGNTSNTATHLLYKTVQVGNGAPFTNGQTVAIDVNDAPVGNYYLSTTARNDFAGRTSSSSSVFNWDAGLQANSVTGGASGANSMIQANAITNTNILAGSLLGTAFAAGSITASALGNSGVVAGSYTSTNITVNAQGLITSAANGTGGGGGNVVHLGEVTYSVAPSQSSLYTVVDLAGEPFYYNAPAYLDGTTVGSSYYYPFFSGTSSTANGYYANSSGSFNPAQASYASTDQGTYGWYSFAAMGFPVAVPAGSTMVKKLTVQLVANANTTVQINPTAFFTSGGNTMYTNDQSIATYDLIANKPMLATTEIAQSGDFSDVSGSGYVIRNMVSGTRVNIVTCIATVDAVS